MTWLCRLGDPTFPLFSPATRLGDFKSIVNCSCVDRDVIVSMHPPVRATIMTHSRSKLLRCLWGSQTQQDLGRLSEELMTGLIIDFCSHAFSELLPCLEAVSCMYFWMPTYSKVILWRRSPLAFHLSVFCFGWRAERLRTRWWWAGLFLSTFQLGLTKVTVI